MTKVRLGTFEGYIKKQLKRPGFKRLWNERGIRYQVARAIIKIRLAKKLSQRQLAQKARTTQAVISRIENMTVDSSVRLIQKIAAALDKRLEISFVFPV